MSRAVRGRSGRAALLALLASCGPVAVSPTSSPPSSTPSAGASSLALASASSPEAPTVASSSTLRPFAAPWPVGDLAVVFPERARLLTPNHLRLQRGVPVVFDDAFDAFLHSREVIVTAHDDEMIRVVVKAWNAPLQMMFWATPDSFESLPTRPQRLALKPGVYPDGPTGLPGRTEFGVWVVAGWSAKAVSRRDGWREVDVDEGAIHARGWLDESLFGFIYTPSPPARGTDFIKAHAVWVASPGGPALARMGGDSESPRLSGTEWLMQPGSAPPGYHQGIHRVRQAWVRGLVSDLFFVPPVWGPRGYGTSAYSVGGWRSKKGRPPVALTLAGNTELLDAPGGDAVGLTEKSMNIPDRGGPPPVDGYRRVDVLFDEVGLVPVWVRQDRVSPITPAASAPASASATTSPSASATTSASIRSP